MEDSASLKHLPNYYLSDDDYEQSFDENLLITKELGSVFFAGIVRECREDQL